MNQIKPQVNTKLVKKLNTYSETLKKSTCVLNFIRQALHFLIESFSTELWHWGPAAKPSKGERERGETFNHYNAHKSLARLVHEFFPGELCPEVITWPKSQDPKVTNCDDTSDHHLNMMHRIHLIPPTYRGNQLRKYLAFMYLQCLAEVHDGISLPTHIQVAELTEIVGKHP